MAGTRSVNDVLGVLDAIVADVAEAQRRIAQRRSATSAAAAVSTAGDDDVDDILDAYAEMPADDQPVAASPGCAAISESADTVFEDTALSVKADAPMPLQHFVVSSRLPTHLLDCFDGRMSPAATLRRVGSDTAPVAVEEDFAAQDRSAFEAISFARDDLSVTSGRASHDSSSTQEGAPSVEEAAHSAPTRSLSGLLSKMKSFSSIRERATTTATAGKRADAMRERAASESQIVPPRRDTFSASTSTASPYARPPPAAMVNKQLSASFVEAARKGQFERVAKLLFRGAAGIDVNFLSKDGMTALHYSVLRSDTEMTLLLLENGADWRKKDARGVAVIDAAPNPRIRQVITDYARTRLVANPLHARADA